MQCISVDAEMTWLKNFVTVSGMLEKLEEQNSRVGNKNL
jgi:hypothetical protein